MRSVMRCDVDALVTATGRAACAHPHPAPAPPVQLRGERYALMAAVELLSHVLREHPILERPGGAPPALRAGTVGGPPPAAPPQAVPVGGHYGAPGGYGARPY